MDPESCAYLINMEGKYPPFTQRNEETFNRAVDQGLIMEPNIAWVRQYFETQKATKDRFVPSVLAVWNMVCSTKGEADPVPFLEKSKGSNAADALIILNKLIELEKNPDAPHKNRYYLDRAVESIYQSEKYEQNKKLERLEEFARRVTAGEENLSTSEQQYQDGGGQPDA